jgi:hypothetical protein
MNRVHFIYKRKLSKRTGILACASLGMMLMWLTRRYKAVTV